MIFANGITVYFLLMSHRSKFDIMLIMDTNQYLWTLDVSTYNCVPKRHYVLKFNLKYIIVPSHCLQSTYVGNNFVVVCDDDGNTSRLAWFFRRRWVGAVALIPQAWSWKKGTGGEAFKRLWSFWDFLVVKKTRKTNPNIDNYVNICLKKLHYFVNKKIN